MDCSRARAPDRGGSDRVANHRLPKERRRAELDRGNRCCLSYARAADSQSAGTRRFDLDSDLRADSDGFRKSVAVGSFDNAFDRASRSECDSGSGSGSER